MFKVNNKDTIMTPMTTSAQKVDRQCTVSIGSVCIALLASSYSYDSNMALCATIFLVVITDTVINKKT